jgi:uncharacterized RDD family membrane protein YckC
MSAASRRSRAQAASGRRAGLVSRLLVAGIDFVVVTALLFGLFLSFGIAKYLLGSDSVDLPNSGPLLTGVGFPIVEFLYLATAWALTGRSVGKQIFGLRAIQADGARLGRWRSCARAAWCTFFGIPSLLWAGVSSRNAAVHDILLRTAVVYDWSDHAEPPMPIPPGLIEVRVLDAAAPETPALTEAS